QSRRYEEREAAGRPSMSRLYVAESTMTNTGGMADHRVAMKAGKVPFFASALASALGAGGNASVDMTEYEQAMVSAIAADVQSASGRAVFVAGATQPPQVHALAASLNGQYGSSAVEYLDTQAGAIESVGPQLRQLVADMNSGAVDAVLCLDTNPVYSLPADLQFGEAMDAMAARGGATIHTGLWRDETAQRATWHLPATHYLEAWGDARAYDGTLSVIQPLIAPLYEDAHSGLEVLNTLTTGRTGSGYDQVRDAFRGRLTGSFENEWRTLLHDGFLPGTGFASIGAGGGTADLSGLTAPAADDLELVFRTSPTLYDGHFSNNAWMQETPDPVTKVTWDGVALMSAATAQERFEVNEEDIEKAGKAYVDVVRITSPSGGVAELPIWIQPGHPNNSVTVFLGYGRQLESSREIKDQNIFERVFDKDVDPYGYGPVANMAGGGEGRDAALQRAEPLRQLDGMTIVSAVSAEKAERTDRKGYLVATTQDHGRMQGDLAIESKSRLIARYASLEEYKKDEDFASDVSHYVQDQPWEDFPSLWGDANEASEDPRIADALYSENQWGMTVDLNACTGCNACVTACQSENNVPIVGKDQVSRGREMHWLRMDRYYVGGEVDKDQDPANVGMLTQPMMCVHCENAPCEQVCPVNATVHSPDGINAMVYNRCIGTRYCANNCPYKVRRYNFYNWTKVLPQEVWMQSNPYVTVRYRGVMEKCTFCVQRIRKVQQYAHAQDRAVEEGEVVTACQQACATNAIVFGDLTDPNSAVVKSKQSPRNYAVLAELAIKPRLTYLARIRNPNPALADYDPFRLEPSVPKAYAPYDEEEPAEESHTEESA
ncbi:MAG: 4Fe-4S dicluster domain-containing protein, partial [Bacteroidota bacterium]